MSNRTIVPVDTSLVVLIQLLAVQLGALYLALVSPHPFKPYNTSEVLIILDKIVLYGYLKKVKSEW
jgi:hypothetical protein